MFLFGSHFYPVYFAWDKIEFSESAFADYFAVERCRQYKRTVCTAETVHFGQVCAS